MTGLTVPYVLIIAGLIFAMGCWQRHECQLRRRAERHATLERTKIRELAERAASDAESCAALIARIDITPQPRPRLHAVRDDHTGQSS